MNVSFDALATTEAEKRRVALAYLFMVVTDEQESAMQRVIAAKTILENTKEEVA